MKKLIIIGIIAAICAGCNRVSPVEKAFNQLEKALEKIEKNKDSMTEADLKNLEQEMEEPLQVISDAFETNKISITESLKFISLMSRWVVATDAWDGIKISSDIDLENFFGKEFKDIVLESEDTIQGSGNTVMEEE